jgi:hypothetical protein
MGRVDRRDIPALLDLHSQLITAGLPVPAGIVPA